MSEREMPKKRWYEGGWRARRRRGVVTEDEGRGWSTSCSWEKTWRRKFYTDNRHETIARINLFGFFVCACCIGVAQNAVVHGVGHRETPADQRPAGGGHLPVEPGQQGAAAPQLGPVHNVRGGGVRVLDGRGRVHVRGAVDAHRLVRDGRLLATRPPRAQRGPVRDGGVRQAVQVYVPVQPPGQRERRVCRHAGHPWW